MSDMHENTFLSHIFSGQCLKEKGRCELKKMSGQKSPPVKKKKKFWQRYVVVIVLGSQYRGQRKLHSVRGGRNGVIKRFPAVTQLPWKRRCELKHFSEF